MWGTDRMGAGMSDLIRREDVFKAIVGLTTHRTVDEIEIFCEDSVAGSEGWLGGIRDALREVEYIPSAEPERKKGEWVEYPDCLRYEGAYADDQIVCSECHHVFSILDNCTEEFDFCPKCGADMTRGK